VAVLACARIGAIHSVVFGGFSSDALGGRIADCSSAVVITADEGVRGGKRVPLKVNVDGALTNKGTECVKHVLVVRRTGSKVPMYAPRDQSYEELVARQAKTCVPEVMNAEDPLFILYTSGSTGQPKGVLHTSGGYLVYASFTHQSIFDLREEDIYWATADIGWVTGHSYVIYGRWRRRHHADVRGVPNYPDTSRSGRWSTSNQVSILYSSPTAIRSLMREARGPSSRLAQEPASARLGGRADQPGGLGMVSPRGRRTSLSDSRHLVADRDGGS